MSFISSAQTASMSMKEGEQLTVEAERDQYRQRYSNMMVLVKEQQQQLAQYKVKCAGIDTLAVILKEAKQESVMLGRQKKALEIAIANLQNRLSTNNLSASVNIEETDLYVPGTSKQTLDNLARENARLRSILKSTEHQSGKKGLEDVQEMKALVENLESGKNQLQAQLQEVESIKFNMIRQYEETIDTLKKDMAKERDQWQREIDKYKHGESNRLSSSDKDSDKDVDRISVEIQTERMHYELVDGLRKSLKHLSEQCVALDKNLENFVVSDNSKESENGAQAQEKAFDTTSEAYQEIQERLLKVTVMNQRWQIHNDAKERQHMADVTELKNEIEAWKQEVEVSRAENARLMQVAEELRQNLNQMRQRPQIDPSIVEILKQQIQVCTEDFNNERKDHEQAVNKNKILQGEIERLTVESKKLKQELDNLKLRQTSPPSQLQARQPVERYSWCPGQYPMPQHQSVQAQGTGFDDLPELPMGPFFNNSGHLASSRPVGRTQNDSSFAFECGEGPSDLRDLHTPMFMSQSQSELAGSHAGTKPGAMASMPAIRRRLSGSDMPRDKGVIACPKCRKEFPEDQTQALSSHIDACKD